MRVADKSTIDEHLPAGRVPTAGTDPRVLVIDDEPLLGQTLKLGLEGSFSVELEALGEVALERLLGGERFDLILCDLSLPNLSGIEIYQQLTELRPELLPRFVLMTGGAVTDEARDFVASYTGAILHKPFRLMELEAVAARILERHGLARRRPGLG